MKNQIDAVNAGRSHARTSTRAAKSHITASPVPPASTISAAELSGGGLARTLAAGLTESETDRTVIRVGMGTCGLAAGAQAVWNVLTDLMAASGGRDRNILLKGTGCIGFCQGEVLVDIKKPGFPCIAFQGVTAAGARTLFEEFVGKGAVPYELVLGILEGYPEPWKGRLPEGWSGISLVRDLPFFSKQKRRVLENCGLIDPDSMEEYIAAGGYAGLAKAISMTPSDVVKEIMGSGLRGRGGGGFPTGRKWQFALDQGRGRKYIVCNADEGDPGAFMDRSVLEGDPHRIIEGMIIGGHAIGASTGYIYCRAEYPLAIKRLRGAIEQAKDAGILGDSVLGSGFSFDLRIKKGAGAFVCGEETALLGSIEGKRGMPKPRPPFPAVAGLFGKPTVINNVETFANVPVILARGAADFSAVGTAGSKGTKVFALTGKINRSGLIEVPMGISLREIVYDIGGGILGGGSYKAAQIGGPSGGCLPDSCLETAIDYDSLIEKGAMMGSGGLVVLDDKTCMIDLARYFIEFTKSESCGKCIPCREGITRLQEMLGGLVRSHGEEDSGMALERFRSIIDLEKTCQLIKDTAACGLGQTAPNPILSTLRYFREEYESHVFERKCPAGKCKSLLRFTVDPEKCRGCGLCKRKCPNEAIVGEVRHSHYVNSDRCVRCGVCVDVCPFDAVNAG